ncbi:MAG: D-alanyl-D-alanine carboxypeptidase [Clostridiales bacterium]|jgi:D-alanyl-D-alanine carboxypeptidase (penicillin-binding protein 5/6)|nr:D-alanyl-D-alanine carboxypeptidase [Clostridiales bacterium]
MAFAVCFRTFGAPAPLGEQARAALLMEPGTGRVLAARNEHAKLPPASVTKIMTVLLIYDAMAEGKIKPGDLVTVSPHAASMGGSQVYLEAMEQQSVEDLLKAVVISSANDGAVALAEFVAGSEEGFVAMMNSRAEGLGMEDTRFVNCCGLPAAGHASSAYDIALMTRELINKYPQVLDISKIWMDTITHKTARGEEVFGLSNTNKLIRAYQGATGLKTGSTDEALFCVAATASRDGLSLISVILGAPDSATRFGEAIKLFDYGFANFKVAEGRPAGDPAGTIKVFKGSREEVPIEVKERVAAVVEKSNSKAMESRVETLPGLSAPVEAGAKAGEIIYTFEGEEVGRSDLVTAEAAGRAGLADMMNRLFYEWVS